MRTEFLSSSTSTSILKSWAISPGPQNIFHTHKSFCLVSSNSHHALSASPPPVLSFSLPCHLPSPLLASGSIKSYSAFKLLSLSQAKRPDFYRQKPSSPSTLILTSLTRRKTLSKSQVCRCTPDFLSSLSLLFFGCLFVLTNSLEKTLEVAEGQWELLFLQESFFPLSQILCIPLLPKLTYATQSIIRRLGFVLRRKRNWKREALMAPMESFNCNSQHIFPVP